MKCSTMELDEHLGTIRLALVFNGAKRKRGNLVVERMNREQARIFSILDMAEFVSA